MLNRVTGKGTGIGRDDRGFTAMEIAMVATVIAILALIVMPIFRNRVNEAKIAACQADLYSLMKAEMLAQADTDYYFRLEDLDNVQNNIPGAAPSDGVTLEIPIMIYSGRVDPQLPLPGLRLDQWRNLAGTDENPRFKGPYATFTRVEKYGDLRLLRPEFFRTSLSEYAAFRNIDSGFSTDNLFDSLENRIPVDPWGNPYLFFPPSSDSAYNYAAIYSTGPDGMPGKGQPTTRENFRREGVDLANSNDDVLGTGDDYEVRF